MSTPGGSSPLRIGGAALLAAGVIAGIIGVATVVGDGDEGVSTAAPGAPGEGADPAATPPVGVPGPGSPGSPEEPGAVPVPSFGDGPPPGIAAPAPGAGNGAPGTGGTGSGDPGADTAGPGGAGSGGTGPGTAGSGGTGPGTAGSGTAAGAGGTGSGGKASAGTGSGGSAAGRSGGSSAPQAARMPLRVYNNSTISGLAAEAESDFEAAGWTVTEVANYSRGIIPTSTVYYRPGTAEQASAERLASEFGLRANPRFEGIEDATPGLIVILTRDYQRR